MATTNFVQRLIEIACTVTGNTGTNQPGEFASSGLPVASISGARVETKIQFAGALAGNRAQVKIYGLTKSLMDQLSTLGMVFNLIPRDTITITAGDADSGMSAVFTGSILSAYGDFNEAPNVPFYIEAKMGAINSVVPVPASSYTGPTSVAQIFSDIAGKMGLQLENNGVDAQLSSPYLSGSALTQMQKAAADAGVNAQVVDDKLCVWPKGGARQGGVELVSPDTGMIGYPTYTQQGIIVRSVFNPRIKAYGQIQVESSLLKASGLWNVYRMDLALDSLMPHGRWESTLYCVNPNYPKPTPPAVQ